MIATPAPISTPAPASAPSDPCGSMLSIVTRPTVSTGVCTVRANHILVENGWSNTAVTGPGGGNLAAYPSTFIRIGTTIPHLEIAFTPPSVVRSSIGGSVVGGSSDSAFGLKYEAGYTTKALWGANVQITEPSGSAAFTAGGTQYTGNANFAYTLTPVLGLAGTLSFNALCALDGKGQLQHYAAFVPSLEVTATLSTRSQAFVEYAYFSHAGLDLPSKSVIDGGYQRELSNNVQVDVEYGFTPTPIVGQQGHYVGVGLSFMH